MQYQQIAITLVDVNPRMVAAWRAVFAGDPEVTIVHGSMLSQQNVSAWVTPTNARGSMDGGLDAAVKRHFGLQVEIDVQREIVRRFGGAMSVGHATCVATPDTRTQYLPRFLISTATMLGSSENVSGTLNVALACAAAFQAAHEQNVAEPGSICSLALPGLGARTGRVPVGTCAALMAAAYRLFREHEFPDFDAARAAMIERLHEVSPWRFRRRRARRTAAPEAAAPHGAWHRLQNWFNLGTA
jgi:O-acetyl-ADP-ribose deacetylase (regulator of RNase III)